MAIFIPYANINLDPRKNAKVGTLDTYSPETTSVVESKQAGSFTSSEEQYFISYNPAVWQETTAPQSAADTDADVAFFRTRDRRNLTTVYISAHKTPSAVAPSLGVDMTPEQLEALATQLERDFDLQSPNPYSKITYVGREIVEINGKQAIRFTFSEELFGASAQYYEYVLPHQNFYLEIETKTVNAITGENLLSEFLAGVRFEKTLAAVLGETSEIGRTESESTALVKPSVVTVVHTFCDEIKGRDNAQFLRTYKVCNGSKGSGFFVGDNHIATNGHVVANFSEEAVIVNLLMLNPQIFDFLVDYVKESVFQAANVRLTTNEAQQVVLILVDNPTNLNALLQELYKSIEAKDFTIERVVDNHYVAFGTRSIETKEEPLLFENIADYVQTNEAVQKVSLVDYDLGNYFSKQAFIDGEKPVGSDVALLRVENTDLSLPSVPLSTATVREGDNILVIGFPGLVSGEDEASFLIDYDASSTQATISKGIISSIKQDHGGRNLFQTDASIDHGNSGGPAFNSNSEVIGIATYGIESQIGSFNFLRDISDLQQLADENNVSLDSSGNNSYRNWQEGLEYFWNARYSRSIAQFERVKKDYPLHPEIDSYIAEAEENIAAGKDVDLLFGIQKTTLFTGVFAVIIGLAIGLGYKKYGSKKTASESTSAPIEVAQSSSEKTESTKKSS